MNNRYESRKDEITDILNFMYQMSNKRLLSHDDVYGVLCYYNLKPQDKLHDSQGNEILSGLNNEHFFPYWIKRFENKRNISTFVNPNWSYFCQFVNNISHSTERFIKLYIPVDAEHLYDGANILFDYLERNNISHLSKISKKVRVDNIIVRLNYDDMATAMKIIEFVNSNPYLRQGLNKPNPFVPTINGIGIMREHGNSYNSDISNYIQAYINECRKRGLRNVNADNFRNFLAACQKNNITYNSDQDNFDDSLLATYDIAYSGQNKNLNANNVPELTSDQKRALLLNALRATYKKYGYDQVRYALTQIVKYNNYSYITNGAPNEMFRANLRKHLTPDDVLEVINTINQVKTGMSFYTVEDKINAYCMDLFSSDMPFILDEICMVTMENHSEFQLQTALNVFINSGDSSYFSRYKGQDSSVNFRDKLKMFDRQTIQEAMISSLGNKGVYASNLSGQELCQMYVSALSRSQVKEQTL